MTQKPYIETIKTIPAREVITFSHNPEYDQQAECICGHSYDRHFDSYENMSPVGCKYCDCCEFVPQSNTKE